MDVGLAERKRDKPIDAKRNASRAYDERQQIKELSVYRVVAFPETPPLVLRREKAFLLLLSVAKFREAVREFDAAEIKLPSF